MENIQIKCPCCKKRLLDVKKDFSGNVRLSISCKTCKTIVGVNVKENMVETMSLTLPKASWQKQATIYTIK